MTASIWIPDLLFEIARHLSTPDISRLSRCNRLSREFMMPLLFRNLSIPIQKATSVAYVLNKYPHYARGCSSFTLEQLAGQLMITPRECEPLFVSLAAVLLALADNAAHLKSVQWSNQKTYPPVVVPTYVWESLGKLSGSLEEFHVTITDTDMNWVRFLSASTTIRLLNIVSGSDFLSGISSIAQVQR
jgi:hypothetical protein